jgi:hypothetical protein
VIQLEKLRDDSQFAANDVSHITPAVAKGTELGWKELAFDYENYGQKVLCVLCDSPYLHPSPMRLDRTAQPNVQR